MANKSLDYFISSYSPTPWEHGVQCSDYIYEDIDLILKFENREGGLQQVAALTDGLITIDASCHKKATTRKNINYGGFYENPPEI